MGDQASLSSFHRDIGIPINIQGESDLVTFRSIEVHEPHKVSIDVRPPVKIRRGTRFFSRDYTEDSDIPLSCEMKNEPAFKTLQGHPNFSRVRESRYPLRIRQHIQGPSHITIAEGRLLLRCLWEGGLHL